MGSQIIHYLAVLTGNHFGQGVHLREHFRSYFQSVDFSSRTESNWSRRDLRHFLLPPRCATIYVRIVRRAKCIASQNYHG